MSLLGREVGMKKCPNCSQMVADTLSKCVNCGKEIAAATPLPDTPTPTATGVSAMPPPGKMDDHSEHKPANSQKMKKFYCLGLDASGKKAEGTFYAPDKDMAAKMVLKQGFRIELLHEVLTKEQIEFRKLVGKIDVILFYTAIVAAIVIIIIIFVLIKK